MNTDFHPELLSILPLRHSVIFPASVVPVTVGRVRSVRLIHELREMEQPMLGVVSQRHPEIDEPDWDDLHEIGTVARVVKITQLGPSNFSVVMHGLSRMKIVQPGPLEPFLRAEVLRLPDDVERDAELDALGLRLREATRELLELTPNAPRETFNVLTNVREISALADLITANLELGSKSSAYKQEVLEQLDVPSRAKLVLSLVERQLSQLKVRKSVTALVEDEGQRQREELLRQQMRQIREELGESDDDDEVEQLRERVRRAQLPTDAYKIARKQLSRLASIPQQSAEFNVTRTYVEWLADLPWNEHTDDTLDVEACRRCLEEDHFGLEKVKKRILEYVAVRKLRADKKGPILCFVGPPGVGKTSLGRSIARSMGRRYHRIALGGVRDEAEIRGHRRTYVGALPGRLMQAMKKVGVRNPVMVLDEIDKLGVDNHGDPAAALLEVLDPAQNDTFQDHYIDTPFDLSQVVFIATANHPERIPGPLMDRLEVIEVPGYTRREKASIAAQHLCPKQVSSHGLTPEQLEFTEDGVAAIIEGHTREAGVRGLEREIGAICRSVAMRFAEGDETPLRADAAAVAKILGAPRYVPESAERKSQPGVVTGLAWTPSGGDILFIEASRMPGRGEVKITGNLRSVMQESAHAAMSFVRSRAAQLGLDPEFLRNSDVHLHVPKGGTPKDGPSAGVAMYVALSSLLLGYPVKREVAMTGEISLRGAVLPVGGIKEKLLAAHRAGISEVLLPEKNRADLEEVPEDVRAELKVHLISRVDQVLPLVLAPRPAAADDASGERDDERA